MSRYDLVRGLYAIGYFLAANACANLSVTDNRVLRTAYEIAGASLLLAGLLALFTVAP